MNLLLILPILIPLLTAATSLLFWRRHQLQRWWGVIGMAALCGAALGLLFSVYHGGIQAVQIGDWPAPFGITLVADLLTLQRHLTEMGPKTLPLSLFCF